MTNTADLKQLAAHRAVEFIQSGMVVGLGTGSTAGFALQRISELLRSGRLKNIFGIPSSLQTERLARSLNIPLGTFEEHKVIDITIDGADEVDPGLNLIKGGGGALLREKVLAQTSRRNIIMVDESKLSEKLGTKWALPLEIIPFALPLESEYLRSLGAAVTLRKDANGSVFFTDQNNLVLDARFGPIADPEALAEHLNRRAGIVEHGLFLGLASEVIVAGEDGIRILSRE